jgi:serine phosphatase RsbU (regulator of sigma subunit)
MRQRWLVLGLLGVVMTLAVVGTALVTLRQVIAINGELAQVSRALHHHKTADEMHDALRADVARAQLVGTGRAPASADQIRRDIRRHATRFRRQLEVVSVLDLSRSQRRELARLRPIQETYVITAEAVAEAALSPRGVTPGAQTDYEAAYTFLVPEQNRLTARLVATTARVEQEAADQRDQAERTMAVAASVALVGWLALVTWHRRSTRRLQGALIREAEHRSAADLLQRSLLPLHLPRVSGARLAAKSVPGSAGNRVGGDWYDAIHVPTGQVVLAVGDVVGHDLPAASVMGQLRNSLRAYAVEDTSPASVLTRVNRAAHLLHTADLATCICVVLDPATMTAAWASAGHPPPLVAHSDGTRRLLEGEPGPPLGVMPATRYPEHSITLAAGDTLLLYSDGLVERRGLALGEGLAALQSIPVAHDDPERMCEEVLVSMLPESQNQDDVTCLLIQVQAEPRTVRDLTATPAVGPGAHA